MFRILLSVLLVCTLGAGPPPTESPQVVDIYPNPAVDGDDGEFVTIWVPHDTERQHLSLVDDGVSAPLPAAGTGAGNPSGEFQSRWNCGESGTRITFSTNPNLTNRLVDRPVAGLSSGVRLANDADGIRLLQNGTVVDTVEYSDAPTAEVYHAETGEWRPLGATDRAPVTAGEGNVTAFVLPDNPDRAVAFLRGAEERILLAGYTLSSERVVEELVAAQNRGVRVEVLVDGSPVGGTSPGSVAALDRLSENDVPVTVLGDDRARYQFHHAKYAVVDGRALVSTENWKPAGLGGNSSRGWAVITGQKAIVDELAVVFEKDTNWVGGTRWQEYDDVRLADATPSNGSYPQQFETRAVHVERTRLLLAPDNAEEELVDAIDGAEESIAIKQPTIGDTNFPLLRATLRAAERGVEVRILLSGAWYTAEENRRLQNTLEQHAERDELHLDVRIADSSEFEKIHAKGLIIDDEQVYLGSLNWNNNSLRENREVVVMLGGEEAASYYGQVFDRDWNADDSDEFPLGLVTLCLLAGLVALLAARRLDFGSTATGSVQGSSGTTAELWSSGSISASPIFSTRASMTLVRIPCTNLMEPTTRWPPPLTPPPSISSCSSVTISGMSSRTPSDRSTAKSGPKPMVMTGSPVSSTFSS